MRLDKLTWKQAENYFKGDVLAVLPVGSVEQHGPLGPLGTDYFIPEEIARLIDERLDVLVLPALPYGVAPHHMSFPGTINVGHDALREVVGNIVSSLMAHGVRRFLILNGHGGNSPALESVCLELYKKGGLAAIIDWWMLAPQLNPSWLGGHGDGLEASVMMAIRPEWVDKQNLFPGEVHHLSDSLQNIHLNVVKFGKGTVKVIRDVRDVVSHGAYGGPDDSALADAGTGQEVLSAVIDYIVAFLAEFKKVSLPASRK